MAIRSRLRWWKAAHNTQEKATQEEYVVSLHDILMKWFLFDFSFIKVYGANNRTSLWELMDLFIDVPIWKVALEIIKRKYTVQTERNQSEIA